jgi:hypothetical protein
LTVRADEVAAFYDGAKVLAVIGPSNVSLTAATHPMLAPYLERHLFSAQPELSICFITTRRWAGWEVETELGSLVGPDGLRGEMSCWGSLALKVVQPEIFAGQLLAAEEKAASALDDAPEVAPGFEDTIDESDEVDADDDEEDDDGPNPIDYFLSRALRLAIAKVLVEEKPAPGQLESAVSARLPALVTSDLAWLGLAVVGVEELELYRDDVRVS